MHVLPSTSPLSFQWLTLPLSLAQLLETICRPVRLGLKCSPAGPETHVSLAGSTGTWSWLPASHGRLMRKPTEIPLSPHLYIVLVYTCARILDACIYNMPLCTIYLLKLPSLPIYYITVLWLWQWQKVSFSQGFSEYFLCSAELCKYTPV